MNSSEFTETADIETSSNDYAKRFSGRVGEYFISVQTESFQKLITEWPNASVLDVGGGHGQCVIPLVNAGYSVTVTGSSEICKRNLASRLSFDRYKFKCCDTLNLPFENDSFDLVFAFRLLPHVDNWQRLIYEMCRVSRYAVIFDYPDMRSFNFISKQLFNIKKGIEGNTRPFRCFTRSEITTEFKKHDFNDPCFLPQFFVPMAIHRGLGNLMFTRLSEKTCRISGLTHFLGSPIVTKLSSGKKAL